ncbi:MBL fold metallo-hydrolase [Novosphingobium sp. M1R2S20]|uniref:MBL fold metallo-hydrolase n=1 Tax=Novosphingobium rhizovicinum TaxID=3228928 RepID=A0ABV3RGC6_9SPHN
MKDEPHLQVQEAGDGIFVIRQSVHTNFEAPFLYLIFGKDRALLLDSGAGGLKIRPTIDRLIAEREQSTSKPISLIVAHSHSHGDHRAGDDEFRSRPRTEVVELSPEQVAKFFHIRRWPEELGHIDLGGRVLDIIPTPGHEPSHIMVYDRASQLLFSGDMLYPGRLYVPANRFGEFRSSVERLAEFAEAHPVTALLGAHIEMTTTPGRDYAMKAPVHADEHPLSLEPSVIAELRQAVADAGEDPKIDRRTHFILFPLPAQPGT